MAVLRAIEVIAPAGPCSTRCRRPPSRPLTTCQTVADVVLSAFAQVVPSASSAHCHGGTLAIYSGHRPAPRRVLRRLRVYAGGSGARARRTASTASRTIRPTPRTCRSRPSNPSFDSRRALRVVPDSGGGDGTAAASRSCARCADSRRSSLGGWGCNQRERREGSARRRRRARASRLPSPTDRSRNRAVHGPGLLLRAGSRSGCARPAAAGRRSAGARAVARPERRAPRRSRQRTPKRLWGHRARRRGRSRFDAPLRAERRAVG